MAHDPAAGVTWIQAGAQRFACALTADTARLPEGTAVRWMIPAASVRLRALSTGDLPSGPNRVRLEIQTLFELGDELPIKAAMPGIEAPLHFQVSQRLAEELALKPGASTDAVRTDRLHVLGRI